MNKLIIFKEKYQFYFFILFSITLFFLALDPNHFADKEVFKNDDKVKHIIAFLILSYLLYGKSIVLNNYIKTILLIVFAFLIEFFQAFTGRESSYIDFIFSVLGIVLFLLLKKILIFFKNN